jgi:hypothetical protein
VIDRAGELLDFAVRYWPVAWPAIVVLLLAGRVARSRYRDVPRRILRTVLRTVLPGSRRSPLVAALVSLIVTLAVFAYRGEPMPHSPDDFGHLLVADTLAHGRLANPPHPLGRHFETLIALQRPTYASPYPIGSGVLYAIGKAVTGIPMAGVWLASALAAALTVWAARGFLTPGWSLLAGLLFALHPTVTWWSTSYHNGSLAACGGALLLGAAARLCRKAETRSAVLGACGIVILMHTRPYEGLFFTLGVALVLLVSCRRFFFPLPAMAIVLAGLALVALHNRAVTGSVFTFPHTEYDRQYLTAPNFLWQQPRPEPVIANEEMRSFNKVYSGYYRRIFQPGGVWEVLVVSKLSRIRDAVFPDGVNLLFLAPLAILPFSLRRRRTRRLLAVLAVSLIAPFAMVWWVSPQYLAPIAALLAILWTLLARELVARFPSHGATIVLALLVFGAINATQAAVETAHLPRLGIEPARRRLAEQLERIPGKHLILVPESIHGAVSNHADIDRSRVIWARDLGDNRALLAYYRGRMVWRLVSGPPLSVVRCQLSVSSRPAETPRQPTTDNRQPLLQK